MTASRTRRAWMAGLLLALTAGSLPASADEPVTVFAAASLKTALDEASAAWTKTTAKTTRISYAGSNALAKQIEAGAPADLFVSADLAWMDYAERNGTIRPDSRVNLLRNAIVLVAPKGASQTIALEPGVDLAKALAGGRLAMGHVDAVPAGKYGKAALEKLGAWDGVKNQVAQAENVRAASSSSPAARRRSASSTPRTRRANRASRWWRPFPRAAIRRSSTRRRSHRNPRTPTAPPS